MSLLAGENVSIETSKIFLKLKNDNGRKKFTKTNILKTKLKKKCHCNNI